MHVRYWRSGARCSAAWKAGTGRNGRWILAGAAALVATGLCSDAPADIIKTTFDTGGADAEVREEGGGTGMRGLNAELATRRGASQNSVMLLRFNISDLTPADLAANPNVTLRLHVNTISWTPARQNDNPSDPANGTQFGLHYYGLKTTAANQNWDESTVTYTTAPGLTFDDNVATKDYNSDATHLGDLDFLPIQANNNLPVGFAWDFAGAGLTSFLSDALEAGADSVTFLVGINEGSSGYNYIFASNNVANLLAQTNWDPDGGGPEPSQTSPFSGADNTAGQFAPRLILSVPEPGSVALFGMAALAGLRRRVRQR